MKFYKHPFNKNYNKKDLTLKSFKIYVGPLGAVGRRNVKLRNIT